MMKIRLISVGRTEDDYIRAGTERFLRQIRHYHPLEEIRIKGVRADGGKAIQKALDREGEKILRWIDRSKDSLILLDREGQLITSEGFASFLEKRLNTGAKNLSFIIGSAEGVSESIRERADKTLSLSRMTLTHEFSRLLFLEQVYRAFTIMKGKRYHR